MRYLNARNTAFGEDRKIYSTVDSTATAGQTVFNVAYDQGRVAVFLNGIRLVPVQDYTYTLSGIGSSITLGAGITANDYLELIGLQGINAGNVVTEDNFVVGTSSTGSGGGYTNSTTVFPVSSSSGDLVSVWRNGIKLVPTTDFTVASNASTVTLQAAANASDEITVHVVGILQHSNFVQATGGTFTGNVAMTGDLTVDTNTLKIDSSNNKIGVGTTAPYAILHIHTETDTTDEGQTAPLTIGSSTSGKMRMYFGINDSSNYAYIGAVESATAYRNLTLQPNGGNVGIGTTTPSSFDSAGNQLVVGSGTGHQGLTINSGSSNTGVIHFADGTTGNESYRGYIYYPHSTDKMEFGTAASTRMTIDSSGNVGINDSTPFGKLNVVDKSWSSGSPYGAVATITGKDTNDLNWGHLMLSDSTTGTINKGGQLRFAVGEDGSNMNPIAGISGLTEHADADYGYLAFYTRPDGTNTTCTERMRIKSNGRVGIGTDAPQQHLEVHDSGGLAYLLINGGGGDGTTTSALQLGGRSASGGNQLAQVSAIRIGDTRGQLVFSTKSSANTLTQRGGFYHGGRSSAREQAFAIQDKRIIYNWYDLTPANTSYKHIKTSLWMGGTQSNSYGFSGNQYYWMGGWRIYAYKYTSSNNFADTAFFFHNWSGNFHNVALHQPGTWDILSGYYTSSDGFCVLRLEQNQYTSGYIDMHQVFNAYPFRDVYVIAEVDTNTSGAQY